MMDGWEKSKLTFADRMGYKNVNPHALINN